MKSQLDAARRLPRVRGLLRPVLLGAVVAACVPGGLSASAGSASDALAVPSPTLTTASSAEPSPSGPVLTHPPTIPLESAADLRRRLACSSAEQQIFDPHGSSPYENVGASTIERSFAAFSSSMAT